MFRFFGGHPPIIGNLSLRLSLSRGGRAASPPVCPMWLVCLLSAHLLAQDGFSLTPASLDRSSASGPTPGLLSNAEAVKQPERNATEEVVCPVCGTNGTEAAKNCCAPGGTWHGTCAAGEHEAEHTFQEGLQACRCENNVVCRLRRDLDRAVAQLDAAKKHQLEALARKDREARLNRLAVPRNNSNLVELQEVLPPPPEQKLYIGRFGTGTTDQWCQKNCVEIAGLCPNERCVEKSGQQADDLASRAKLNWMSAPEHQTASSAQKQLPFEQLPDAQKTVRGDAPAGVDAIHQPQNQIDPPPAGSPDRKRRESAAVARSAQQPPAPSAQQPALSAQRPPSGNSAAPKVAEMCPGHPNILRSSPACTERLAADKAAKEAAAATAAEAKAAGAASKHEGRGEEEEMCPGHPNIRRSSPTCQAALATAAAGAAASAGRGASADTGLRETPMTDELKPVARSHCSASDTGPIKVAVLIAMDIRLPKGGGHCVHPGDPLCDSREDVLGLFNGITKGSDVFVATDRAFQDDVKDIKHVVAVRYSEDVGGGMPKNMPGQMRQWWRLKQVRVRVSARAWVRDIGLAPTRTQPLAVPLPLPLLSPGVGVARGVRGTVQAHLLLGLQDTHGCDRAGRR